MLCIVIVVRGPFGIKAITPRQGGGDAGVLAGDEVDLSQDFERAERDVAEIADRRRNQIEAGRQGLGRARRRFTSRCGLYRLHARSHGGAR